MLPNSVDRLGRTVESLVFSVAEQIAPHAVSHGERILHDPAIALTLFEEVAATVSEIVKDKAQSGKPAIRDLKRYLFRTYFRRVDLEKKVHPVLENVEKEDWKRHVQKPDGATLDSEILMKELLASCDTLKREILYLKLQGWSGKEIQESCGIPENAVNLRFSKAIRRFQNMVRGENRSTPEAWQLGSGEHKAEKKGPTIPD